MNEEPPTENAGPGPSELRPSRTGSQRLGWLDVRGGHWSIELQPDSVELSGTDSHLRILTGDWAKDIYVQEHLGRFLIRFETFRHSVAFDVSAQQAAPLLEHLATSRPGHRPDVQERRPGHRPDVLLDESSDVPALLWPKVSTLAVWALICSSLVFVPVLGWMPAVATTVLLILHRLRVRRAHAWDHSRRLCVVAFVNLVAGSAVSVLATRGLIHNGLAGLEARTRPPVPRVLESSEQIGDSARLAESSTPIWQRDYNWPLILAAIVVVLASLTIHEAAHAITAWWLGDDFARRLGRVTLNPLAHLDPIGSILLPLLSFLADAGVFGWARPVPVRLENVERPHRAHILIALAGPGSNLLLASASLMLLLGIGCLVELFIPGATVENLSNPGFSEPVSASGFALAPGLAGACTILKLSFLVNVFLAFFNLIPIPPLDGSWVLQNLFPFTLGRLYEWMRPYSFLLFLGLIYSDVLFYLMIPSYFALIPGFILLAVCTPY